MVYKAWIPSKRFKKMPAGKVFKNNPSQILVLKFLRITFLGGTSELLGSRCKFRRMEFLEYKLTFNSHISRACVS